MIHNIELSDKDLSLIESALYRFIKDNELDMSEELRKESVNLYRKLRELEGLPMNLK